MSRALSGPLNDVDLYAPDSGPLCSRRVWLRRSGALAAASVLPGTQATAALHGDMGAVAAPFRLPQAQVQREDGRLVELNALLQGRVTALQLVFTGCGDTCPIQGAIFGQLLPLLPAHGPAWQLLSLSTDPLGDSPQRLKAWRERWSTDPRWQSVLPSHVVLDRLLPVLKGRLAGSQPHTTQVFLFDREARLVMRSADLPSARMLAGLMQRLGGASAPR